VLLPLHPRTRKNIALFGLDGIARSLVLTESLGYLELMSLVEACTFVVTDSGGLQKEAFYAGKRAVVMMSDTGWRELTACGWNVLCAPEPESIAEAGLRLLHTDAPHPGNIYGEGNAAEEIVRVVQQLWS
jgi:UDP-N-acetylglucosamine 2-epimerase (non-hydrolysing)